MLDGDHPRRPTGVRDDDRLRLHHELAPRQREHSVQQPARLDRILIPPQRLKTTRVVTVVVLMVASAWALQSSLRAEQAVNRRPMKIERSSPI